MFILTSIRKNSLSMFSKFWAMLTLWVLLFSVAKFIVFTGLSLASNMSSAVLIIACFTSSTILSGYFFQGTRICFRLLL